MKQLLILLPLCLALGAPAFAQKPIFMHEFTGGTNSVFSFSSDTTSIGASLGYNYLLVPEYGVQVGVLTNLSFLSTKDASVTLWNNVFRARYNIAYLAAPGDIVNEPFVEAGIGFALRNNTAGEVGNTTTKLLWEAGLGKRFRLANNIAYVPSFSISKVSDESVAYNFTVIAISVFL